MLVLPQFFVIFNHMTTGPVQNSKIFEFIPREWLTKYLAMAVAEGGMSLQLLDARGEIVTVAPGGAGRAKEDCGCPEGNWSRVGELLGEGIRELECDGGYFLAVVPLSHREERLGYLAACAPSGDGRDARHAQIRTVLTLAASHLEGVAESGYEVENLSGEVVRVYEELTLIYRLTERLGIEVQLEEIFRVVVDEAEKILHPTDIVLQLADEEQGTLRTVFASGAHRSNALTFSPGLEAGVIGRSFANHRSILVSEMAQELQEPVWPFPVQRLLVVPLVADNKCLGVIFATDKIDGSDFDTQEDKLFSVMASVAAIAIKNAQLYSDIKKLFEGFVTASVTAVESRDPTTAGHSTRVAHLMVELAKYVDASDFPPFRNVSFTGEQLLEMRYAGLLHDFGKIGVRESVLLKDAKLYQVDLERIVQRFDYIRERKTREALERKLEILLIEGKDAYLRSVGAIEIELGEEFARLEETRNLLEEMNKPQILLTELPGLESLQAFTERYYTDSRGEQKPYLAPFEFNNLHVLKGSLNEAERRDIESHVTHSFNFLSKIPWTKNFPRIAEMVYTHHEKLDGSGYPRKLKEEAIPLQAKMMTVTDIFDALTAWDRPYKRAVPVEKALFILEIEAREGKLDTDLVRLFIEAKVYTAVEGLRPKP